MTHRVFAVLTKLSCVLLCAGLMSPVQADDEEAIVPEEVNLGRPVEFRRDIYPILAGSCLACHNRTKAESDYVLETAELAIKGGAAGEAIVPGEPDESYLYMVAARTEEPVMPPMPNSVQAKPLTPKQLGLLRQWILEGAKGDEAGGAAGIAWQAVSNELKAVYSIDADPTGRFVAAGRANKVTVYDLKAPAAVRQLVDPALESPGVSHRDYANAIAFHPNGELIATAGYQVVKLWKRGAVVVDNPAEVPVQDINVSGDGKQLVKISAEGAAQLFLAEGDKLVADLNRDLQHEQQAAQLEADRAMREARVNVVKKQVEEHQKRLEEQNTALKTATEKHTKATEAVPEAEKKLTEAQTAVVEPEKQLAEDKENAEKKKKVDELKKTVTAAEKAVTDAKDAVESAARGIELAKQSVQRAEERLQARKDLQTQSETELQQATTRRDEAKAAAAAEMKVLAAVFITGQPLVATIERSGTVRLWNTTDGTPVDVLASGTAIEGSLKTAGTDGRLLSIVTDADVTTTVDLLPDWQLAGQIGPQDAGASAFEDRVLSLAFSPDGARLATGGGEASRSGELTIWKTADWTLEREIEDAHSDTVYGLDFSDDGRFLASGAADKFVKVFNVENGEHVRSYEGHTHHVMDVSWKGDRTSLVSAGADNVLKVWDAETGEQRRTISGYKKQVTSVSYVGLQDQIVSSSGDKKVNLHQTGDGKLLRGFGGSPDYVYCSSVTPDGKVVVAGGEDGVVRVWNGADAKSLHTFAAN